MRKLKIVIATIMGALLCACATARVPQELEQGKFNFQAGNYPLAFHQLLPLASEGNAMAQYAVGYMYYYGYGVPRDAESGLFWMKKSADQHFAPAIQALELIRNHPPSGFNI